MENIEIVKIEVHAKPGATQGECFQDCIELAAKEWKDVKLTYNELVYNINVNDLVLSIKEVKGGSE
jgi:hypothetical protein